MSSGRDSFRMADHPSGNAKLRFSETSLMRLLLWLLPSLLAAQTYDIVLQRDRVLDPESGR